MSSSAPMETATGYGRDERLPPGHGELPAWEVSELPAAPPFNMRNLFKVIGPGAVMAATSIGGGEWLVGPANAVKYGTSIFLIATVAIVLQVIFNLEAIRYTLYTGEPIYGGIMRMKPGPRFWATYYNVIGFLQLGSPGLAGGAAVALLSGFLGKVPGLEHNATRIAITAGVLFLVVFILSFGGTIERMLEYFSWTMLVLVFTFLIIVNVAYVPLPHWWKTFTGFFKLTGLQHPIDWRLLGALAATAGSGGLGNLTVTNWVRDKGFGMGSKVGAIPSAFAGHQLQLSHVGKIFPVTDENMARWKVWMKYVVTDQIWVWGLFCFLGMYLNVNLATAIIPAGFDMGGPGAGSYQAQYLRKIWDPLWFITLFCGFWVLFKTQLGNTDILVRTVTDTLWMSSSNVRKWKGGRVQRVYYTILAVFTGWALVAVFAGTPMQLFTMLANIAGLVLAIAGVQVFLVNRRFLPKALQPGWWQNAGLLLCSAFYAFFSFFVVRDMVRAWMK